MTIQLTAPILIAGVHQASGTSLTLGADVEAELVNRGVAVYTSRQMTPGEGVAEAQWNLATIKLRHPLTGVDMEMGSAATKLVSVASVPVACANNTDTPQGLSATDLTDTHSLVDTVNGTVLIPSDATLMSAGVSVPTTFVGAASGAIIAAMQIELFAGIWISVFERNLNASAVPQVFPAGAIVEMISVNESWNGKKARFVFKQTSGGTVTPGASRFYAQFMSF